MTDIRPVRDHEAEDFLRLLCDVFDLDFERARAIFFNEPLYDLHRKWALFEGPEMVSILTTVPLQFGWGRAIGIAGVATRADRQREGHAGRLVEKVLRESAKAGEESALLFARDIKLYSRLGFEVIDEVVRASIDSQPEDGMSDMVSFDEVQALYDAWAEHHPDRLRRDSRRWQFWKWNLRICTPLAGGYLCHEGRTIRECILRHPVDTWRLPPDTDWLGTRFMASQLGIPLKNPEAELNFMAYNLRRTPQIFMTDQF